MSAIRTETLAEGVTRARRAPRPNELPRSFAVVYALCSPNSGKVRYVGKTIYSPTRRLGRHIQEAKSGKSRPVLNWIRVLLAKGKRPIIIELEDVAIADAEVREIYWIAHHRRAGCRLLNLTAGGEGLPGHKFAGTDHARKIGAALRRGRKCKCVRCGAPFWRKPNQIAKGQAKFCSRLCSNRRSK